MTSVFEDRLWEVLKEHAVDGSEDPRTVPFPAPRHRVVTGRRVGAVLVAAAVAGIGLAALPGGGGTPSAYAVEPSKGGEVIVSLEPSSIRPILSDSKAFEAELRGAGLTVVDNATGPYTCRSDHGHGPTPGPKFEVTPKNPDWQVTGHGTAGSIRFHMKPRSESKRGREVYVLHQGDTAFFNTVPLSSGGREFAIEFYPASCVPASGS